MRKLKAITSLVVCVLMCSCSANYRLADKEEKLNTNGTDMTKFHRVATKDKGLALRFPGYLIGIEKTYKSNNLGESWFCEDNMLPDFRPTTDENQVAIKQAKSILDDCKPTVISHIVKYQLSDKKPNSMPFISEQFIYDLYSKDIELHKPLSKDDPILTGQIALSRLEAELSQQPFQYSHIFLFAMGWNTDQQEAIRNYNSLITNLIESDQAPDNFNPLFIGITWPSEWSWGVFLDKLLSYPIKADDADEIGLKWVYPVLTDILKPLKREHNVPIVALGHSFGARMITRAVFAHELLKPNENNTEGTKVDLVVALQGAFSVNRFFKESGFEGNPYKNHSTAANKIVMTWSEHDTANPIAKFVSGALHVGGKPGFDKAHTYACDNQSEPLFTFYEIQSPEQTDKHYHKLYQGVVPTGGSPAWHHDLHNESRIAYVNASELIHYDVYQKGGGAHSDIYTPGVASFLWDVINTSLSSAETALNSSANLE
ncbi:hypothetical protein C3B51_10535 [Pseudoalteromonas rubra]|uniref:Alpha/beta hydrolase n=1 Tax=Pseudoalteromonas rubra TaxID=43658 RepID=A0A4Q7ED39_9GAMM|nr:alpha/beta hydrolase [Pseudoalteromonas rubra]RZM80949.1 hypothetical protein C3B51_10535 [Pseudoalteromonas rubra]